MNTLADFRVGPAEKLTADALGRIQTGFVPAIKKIRTSHHEAAKALARGLTYNEVAAITGYSPIRIYHLTLDPTFAELVSHYAAVVNEAFVDVIQRMKNMSLDAMEELQSRLDETPECFDNDQLLKVATSTLDRTGFAPQSKVAISVTTLTKDDILALREAARESVITASTLPALSDSSTDVN